MTTVHASAAPIKPCWRSIDLVGRSETFDGAIEDHRGSPVPAQVAKLDHLVDIELDDVEPFISPEDCGFQPNPAQAAYWSGFSLARNGEDVRADRSAPLEIRLAFSNGRAAAQLAIEADDAFDRGRRWGLVAEVLEIPDDFAPHQAEAMTRGFAVGRAEFEAEREELAWAQSETADRLARAFRVEITDLDAWPIGCVS